MWDVVGQFSSHAYFTLQVNYCTDRLITESDRGGGGEGGALLTLLNLQTHSLWYLIGGKETLQMGIGDHIRFVLE